MILRSQRKARGNSGVILSQLFRGFTKEIKTVNVITTTTLANAFVRATETAYKAVMKPKEGTILTVAKGMADIGFCGTDTHNPDCVFESFIKDHLVIITPNTERFRQMQSSGMKAEFLKNEPIILREDGSGTRKEMEHFLTKYAFCERKRLFHIL